MSLTRRSARGRGSAGGQGSGSAGGQGSAGPSGGNPGGNPGSKAAKKDGKDGKDIVISNPPASWALFSYESKLGFVYTEDSYNQQLAAKTSGLESFRQQEAFPRPVGVSLDDWNREFNKADTAIYNRHHKQVAASRRSRRTTHNTRELAEQKLLELQPHLVPQQLPVVANPAVAPILTLQQQPPANTTALNNPSNNKNNSTQNSSSASSSVGSNLAMASNVKTFCICQKPDDGTKMIGCDGGCKNWFHIKCMGISAEDQRGISMFICTNCTVEPTLVTTYKRRCRLEGCEKPHMAIDPKTFNPSKYCSAAHRSLFWKIRTDKMPDKSTPGGALSKGEARALLAQTPKGEFKNLGLDARLPGGSAANTGPSTRAPPASKASAAAPATAKSSVNATEKTAKPAESGKKQAAVDTSIDRKCKGKANADGPTSSAPKNAESVNTTKGVINGFEGLKLIDPTAPVGDADAAELNRQEIVASFDETEGLNKIERQRRREGLVKMEKAEVQLAVQNERLKLINMIKKYSDGVVEEYTKENNLVQKAAKPNKSGKKPVNVVCGYDPRLSCNDQWLVEFKKTEEGAKAWESGVIGEDTTGVADVDLGYHKGLCTKVKCQNHFNWYEGYVDDVALAKKNAREIIDKTNTNLARMRDRVEIRQAVVLQRENYVKWRLEQMTSEEAKLFENAIQSKSGDPEVILRKLCVEIFHKG